MPTSKIPPLTAVQRYLLKALIPKPKPKAKPKPPRPVMRQPLDPDPLAEQTRAFIRAAKASATLRAYRSDWQHFTAWCENRVVPALPASPETVALYLTALAATHRPATLSRRLTAIAKAHAAAGQPNPATTRHIIVAETLQGIRRTLGTAQQGKTPLLTADLVKVLKHLPTGPSGIRDRALLLVGFTGGLRRSELARLTVTDMRLEPLGMVLILRRSKTDQEGRGRLIALPKGAFEATCPFTALLKWLVLAKMTSGPIFRKVDRHGHIGEQPLHPDSIGGIVKRAVKRAGFTPEHFAGHSLRAGFATQAARNGVSAFDIMRQTGHRSIATVSRYVREAQILQDSPASKLGL